MSSSGGRNEAQSTRHLSLSELTKLRKDSEIQVSKGKILCLEDERTRSVREDPRSVVTTVGFEEGAQALTP
jgi:hypothetical protein